MTGHLPTLAPEVVFTLGQYEITNTIINAWLAIAIFLITGLFIRFTVSLRPGKIQNFFEQILEYLFEFFDQVTGERAKTIRFLPVVGTVFFFILLSNWLGLLPGTGSLKWGEAFLLRPANTDLNLTLAMAVLAVVSSHVFGLFTIGFFAHVGKYIQIKSLIQSFRNGPIAVFTALVEILVGLIEIVSEATKVLSLSLRLFGNIFAGEVLITVISGLVAVLAPAPFMLLEFFVGLIQAGVFAMLTLAYLTLASSEPHNVVAEEH